MSDILTGPDRGPPKFDWRDKAIRVQDALDAANAKLRTFTPYPPHCRHVLKCAGLTNCPRDPICID